MPGKCSGTGCAVCCAGSDRFSISPLADRTPCVQAVASAQKRRRCYRPCLIGADASTQVTMSSCEATKANAPMSG